MTFKIGDTVMCVNDNGRQRIIEGKTYTVIENEYSGNNNYCRMKGVTDYFSNERFVLHIKTWKELLQ